MKKLLALLLSIVVTSSSFVHLPKASAATTNIKDVVGVTHVSGKYFHQTNDFLNEGADKIEALGTSVIKLWLSNSYSSAYPYNSDWSQFGTISNMTQLIQTSYYQNILNRAQLKTFIFETMEFCSPNWKDGFSTTESTNVYNEIYNLTVYLRNNPTLATKTVVLQNWEGDNALNASLLTTAQQDIAIQGMIDWLNTRQDAITAACNATSSSTVNVYGAAEVNELPVYQTFSYPLVIDRVVPYTHMDLYSYSDWSTKEAGEEWKLKGLLDYVKLKAPDSTSFGENNIYLGEFGCYEMTCTGTTIDAHTTDSDRIQREIVGRQLEQALKWGVKWAVYWEIYCNGTRQGVTITPPQEATENQLKGVWLIRPDGSLTATYNYLTSIMNTAVSDYLSVFEAENQPIAVSSGDTQQDTLDTSASGKYTNKLMTNAVNDYSEYTLYIPETATYSVKIKIKKFNGGGICQLKVNDMPHGSAFDTYSASTTYTEVDLGTRYISSGNKLFKFAVTGKNSSSSDYDIIIDSIKLIKQ